MYQIEEVQICLGKSREGLSGGDIYLGVELGLGALKRKQNG